MDTNPKAGLAMVLAAAVLWGTTGTAQALASGTLAPAWFGALRLATASAFFAVWLVLRSWRGAGAPASAATTAAMPAVLAAGLCLAVYNLAFFAGVRDAGVAAGTAIALGSGPLWAGALQAATTRVLPRPAWWCGTAAAIGGGTLLAWSGAGTFARVGLAGVALCLLAGLAYAVYTLLCKHLVRSMPAATLTFGAFTAAACIAVPLAWLDAGVPVLRAADAGAVAYVGIVTAGVAYLLYTHALRHVSAASGVALALLEPVTAFVLAVAVVGEPGTAAGAGGLVLVLAGVLVVGRAELRLQRNAGLSSSEPTNGTDGSIAERRASASASST